MTRRARVEVLEREMQSLRNGLAREDAARWADDADSIEAQRRAERAAESLAAALDQTARATPVAGSNVLGPVVCMRRRAAFCAPLWPSVVLVTWLRERNRTRRATRGKTAVRGPGTAQRGRRSRNQELRRLDRSRCVLGMTKRRSED